MSDSQGPTVVTVSVVFAVLTAVVMSMRLYARVFIVQKLGLDDGKPTKQETYLRTFSNRITVLISVAAVSGLKTNVETARSHRCPPASVNCFHSSNYNG